MGIRKNTQKLDERVITENGQVERFPDRYEIHEVRTRDSGATAFGLIMAIMFGIAAFGWYYEKYVNFCKFF